MMLLALFLAQGDVERFPPPDFDSSYVQPETATPFGQAGFVSYLDISLLILALGLASYLALKKRNRRGLFCLMVFSLAYFGFYKEGCVCPIGAIQNVSLALFNGGYVAPFTVTIFFLAPLLTALLFGRTFCAAVCPLGAIQDLALIKPIKVPSWIEHSLGLLAYIYLGAAVLFAATGSAFIICQYDPFVSLFRLTGSFNMVVLGISFIVISFFIGRPYCRYFCPYGVLQRLLSSISKWRVTVTPDDCIECRLCEESCPFNAINPSDGKNDIKPESRDRVRLALLLVVTPILIAAGGWLVSRAAPSMSRMNSTVILAERVQLEETGVASKEADDQTAAAEASEAFRDTGRAIQDLYDEAKTVRSEFYIGGWVLGCFLGLVIALKLINLSVFRRRDAYEADRAACMACGRCFSYCPVELEKRK